MSWELILALFIGGLLVCMLIGIPIAMSFLLVNTVTAAILFGTSVGAEQMVLSGFRALSTFALIPVPLFVIMGEILYHSGLAVRTLDAMAKWLGPIPGRLSILTMLSGTVFAALSGSAIANTAMLGSLLVPEMTRRGYSKEMSVGPILASGGLAMLIPPSAVAVLIGSIGRISIGKLLIGGILPGLLVATLAIGYIVVRCWLNPNLAPRYQVAEASGRDRWTSLVRDILPLSILVFLVVGVIFLGIATPTEAAALGTAGAMAVTYAYGAMNRRVFASALMGSVKISGMILLIIAGSAGFSQLLAYTGASRSLVDIVINLPVAPLVVILMMQLLIMFLGCFFEQISILMVTIPLFLPMAEALGFDPVWFGVLVLLNVDLANLTPPFGMTLFVMKGVTPPDFSMSDIIRSAVPFILIEIVVLGFMLLFPQVVLFLPSLVRG